MAVFGECGKIEIEYEYSKLAPSFSKTYAASTLREGHFSPGQVDTVGGGLTGGGQTSREVVTRNAV